MRESRVLARLCNNSTSYKAWSEGRKYFLTTPPNYSPSYMHGYEWSHPNFVTMNKESKVNTMKRMLGIPVTGGKSISLTDIVPIGEMGFFHSWHKNTSRDSEIKTLWIGSQAVAWLDKWHSSDKVECFGFENEFPVIVYDLVTGPDLEIFAKKDSRSWFFIGLEDGSMTLIGTENSRDTCYLNDERYVCRDATLLRFDNHGRPHSDLFLKGKAKTEDNYKVITGRWYDRER